MTYAAFNDGGKREIVEHFGAVAPDKTGAILAHAFVVEAIHLCDLSRFVVPADESHPVRIADL